MPRISQPISAFITFESNKAKEKVLSKMKSKKSWLTSKRSPNKSFKLFGVHPIIKKAPEPSDIIWENYSVLRSTVRFRKLRMFTLMALSYLGLFFLSIKVFTFKTEYESKFSLKIICNLVNDGFNRHHHDDSTKEQEAIQDKAHALQGHGIGMYFCYCRDNFSLSQLILSYGD